MDIETFNMILMTLAIGVGFFAFSVFAMVALFGLSMGETVKNAKGMAVLAVLSLGIPFGVMSVNQRTYLNTQADSFVGITGYSQTDVGGSEYLVNFTTSEPAIAFMEYEDDSGVIRTLLPTYSLDYRMEHSVLVPKYLIDSGDVEIIVNGVKYEISR